MRLARVAAPSGSIFLARLTDDDLVVPLVLEEAGPGRDALRDALAAGIDFASAPAIAAELTLAESRLLAPVRAPDKVLAIGLNYADHAEESGATPPASPVTFVKTTNSIIGPDDKIRYSKDDSTQVDYEAELGRGHRSGRPARHRERCPRLCPRVYGVQRRVGARRPVR